VLQFRILQMENDRDEALHDSHRRGLMMWDLSWAMTGLTVRGEADRKARIKALWLPSRLSARPVRQSPIMNTATAAEAEMKSGWSWRHSLPATSVPAPSGS
jgi:hypothetical protein